MPARSSSMPVQRVTSKAMIQYNASTDEMLISNANKTMALRWDEFIEAIERRIQDKMYRPISEESRAQQDRERGGR